MLHVGLLEWFPAELMWLYVDHTTSTDCGRGSLLQVLGPQQWCYKEVEVYMYYYTLGSLCCM